MPLPEIADVPVVPNYARGLALFYPPQPLENAKDVDGAALSWPEYQAEVKRANLGLLENQRRWQHLIQRAESSTGIERTAVTLAEPASDENRLTYQSIPYETPFRRN